MKLSIKTTFDFGKLANKLPEILEKYMDGAEEIFAKDAADRINSGKMRGVTKGTMEIAKKKLSPKRPYPRVGSKSQGLIHSGSLRANIKQTKDGVSAPYYLKHHLKDYKIVENAWTKKFARKAIGKTVKARNPFFTPKGNLYGVTKKKFKKRRKVLYKSLGKALKK
jgi:hypothetical protein